MSIERQENLFFQALSNPVSILFFMFLLLCSGLAWGQEAVMVGLGGDACTAWSAGQDPKLEGAIWANKDGEEDEDEIEVVIDGRPSHVPPEPLTSALDCLCRLQLQDDHGDVFPCATSLEVGEVVSGHLDASDGDRRLGDRDLFVVPLWGQDGGDVHVRWSWSANVSMGLRLLDASGRPRAVFRAGSSSDRPDDSMERPAVEHQRLRLPSGLYFLEMRSVAAQDGDYAMALEILD